MVSRSTVIYESLLDDILEAAYKFDDKPHLLARSIQKAAEAVNHDDREEIKRLMEYLYYNAYKIRPSSRCVTTG